MPEEFPMKDPSHGCKLTDIQNVCKCGHRDYYHFEDDGCYSCTCEKYVFEQKLTRLQAWELEDHILKRAEKVGNIQ